MRITDAAILSEMRKLIQSEIAIALRSRAEEHFGIIDSVDIATRTASVFRAGASEPSPGYHYMDVTPRVGDRVRLLRTPAGSMVERIVSRDILADLDGGGGGGAHPDLATHDALGLATDSALGLLESQLEAHEGTPHGGGSGISFVGCRVERTTVFSVPNAVDTAIPFDTGNAVEIYDDGGLHSLTTNPTRLTAQQAGKYHVDGACSFASNASGGRIVSITVTDVSAGTKITIARNRMIYDTAAIQQGMPTSADVILDVGDYVELEVYQNSGGALNTTSPSSTDRFVSLNMHLIGGVKGDTGAAGAAGAAGATGPTGPAGPGVPVGGTTGQVLAKTSNSDFATGWTPAGGGLTDHTHAATGSGATGGGDALEPDHIQSRILWLRALGLGDVAFGGWTAADDANTFNRWQIRGDGTIEWGPSVTTYDTRQRRSGVKTLTFDDGAGGAVTLNVVGTIQQGGVGVSTTAHAHAGVYEPAGTVGTHAAAADPHTGYQKESEKGVASGYASLDSGVLVPVAQLGTGTPDGTKFLRDDRTWAVPAGGGGGAPTNAQYLVAAADATLSAEVVVGATPGGELGGTWAAPTVDASHGGGTHAATQAAAEATAAGALSTHAAAADPHTGYQRESEKNQPSGYAGLDASTRIANGQLGSGTPDKFNALAGDRTWDKRWLVWALPATLAVPGTAWVDTGWEVTVTAASNIPLVMFYIHNRQATGGGLQIQFVSTGGGNIRAALEPGDAAGTSWGTFSSMANYATAYGGVIPSANAAGRYARMTGRLNIAGPGVVKLQVNSIAAAAVQLVVGTWIQYAVVPE